MLLSMCVLGYGENEFAGNKYNLITIGSTEIQNIISGAEYVVSPDFTDRNDCLVLRNSQDAEHVENDLQISDEAIETSETITDSVESADTSEEVINNEIIESPASGNADAPLVEDTSIIDEEQRREIEEKCARLNKVFRDYGISAYPVEPDHVLEAARFTRFEVKLKPGERFNSIDKHKVDIGIQLEANGEILAGHIRGTQYVSVDVPFAGNGRTIQLLDHLNLLKDKKGNLNIVAGQKPDSQFEVLDLSKAPHLLVAGTTGSGKTIFLYSIIVSLLNQFSKDELELLIIDPKQTDFTFFEELPHLYGGHIVTDAEEALEMIKKINSDDKEERTAKLKSSRSRDIESYNAKNPGSKMKRLVVVIDEYADLIQAAEMQGSRKEFEDLLVMLAQRVRNLGIHFVIATQRPTAKIVTGTLKANIPYRVSFRLPSHQDSQTILDEIGAENLLGKGDMIMKTDSDTMRMQGLFISEDELENYIEKILRK